MINYMPITPVGLLGTLDTMEVRNAFMLTHLWEIKRYREFYQTHQFDTVILDNDLYEKPTAASFDHMLKIASQIDAERIFVVGPECLTDGVKTGQMTLDLLTQYESEGYLTDNVQMMCILHERPNEMLRQWNLIKHKEDVAVGISIFSYRLGYDRASLHKFLNLPRNRYTHAFGWDNLLEVYNMRGCFDSVDSSLAVSAAYNGVDLMKAWQITRDEKKDGRVIKDRLDLTWAGKPSVSLELATCKNIHFLRQFCRCEGPIYKQSELPV